MVITGILIAIAVLLGIVFSRLVTTFIHELGHTISAILLSGGEVHMFVGSYGNQNKTLRIKLGRLKVYLRMNIVDLRLGMTVYEKMRSDWRAFIVILLGPLFSLGSTFALLYFLFQPDYSDGVKFIIAVFMFSSFFDFLVNIIPAGQPVRIFTGRYIFNDGMQLKNLIQKVFSDKKYYEVIQLIESGSIAEATEYFEKLDETKKNVLKYQLLKLDIDFLKNDSESFFTVFEEMAKKSKIPVRYIVKWAKLKLKKHQYDDVIKVMSKYMDDGIFNYDFHLLRGKALTGVSEYREALFDFNALTLGDEIDPLGLANRAYCQFRLGYIKEAKEDIIHAIKLNKNELGEIYFLAGKIHEQSDEEASLSYFKKAKVSGYDHHSLDFQISWLEGSKDSKDL